ncbi:hypothetical protein ABPG75_000549 [Micractinium tetrahymenae]
MAERGGAGQFQLELLERRWAAEARQAAAEAEALYLRAAALAAAVHYSRHVALHWGWAPWRARMEQARQQQAAAAALCAKHTVARVLQAVHAWRRLAAWQAVTAEACATAAARQHRQRSLLQRSLAALSQHAHWVHDLPRLHTASLAAAALRRWRQLAAAAAAQAQMHDNVAAEHSNCRAARRVLKAWRLSAKLASRREKRWGAVQQYLAEHRAARQAAAAAAAGSLGCDASEGRCGVDGTASSLSSAENSFDPNSIFYPPPGHLFR